jgi:hypothetical protein
MGRLKEEYLNNIPSDEDLEEYYQYYISTSKGRNQCEEVYVDV